MIPLPSFFTQQLDGGVGYKCGLPSLPLSLLPSPPTMPPGTYTPPSLPSLPTLPTYLPVPSALPPLPTMPPLRSPGSSTGIGRRARHHRNFVSRLTYCLSDSVCLYISIYYPYYDFFVHPPPRLIRALCMYVSGGSTRVSLYYEGVADIST